MAQRGRPAQIALRAKLKRHRQIQLKVQAHQFEGEEDVFDQRQVLQEHHPLIISHFYSNMKRFIEIAEFSPIRRALASLRILTRERLQMYQHMRFISRQDMLYN